MSERKKNDYKSLIFVREHQNTNLNGILGDFLDLLLAFFRCSES